jgi:uncharacterized membrane protein
MTSHTARVPASPVPAAAPARPAPPELSRTTAAVCALMSAAAVAVARRSARAGQVTVVAGAALVAWTIGEVLVIRTYSWMQPVCGTYGLGVVALRLALLRQHRAGWGAA